MEEQLDRLEAAVPGLEHAIGDDLDHPGRYFARVRWDDTERKIHESLSAVNCATPALAVDGVIEEYRHMLAKPELHWPYE
jgi:hypothetical protein